MMDWKGMIVIIMFNPVVGKYFVLGSEVVSTEIFIICKDAALKKGRGPRCCFKIL
ncbi:hypothetical protein GJV44_00502 [Candidatus Vallotia cooleyia]|nr:hypothetical protein GJV44_00502 [Candidatus Vallotia cooleyia]